MAKNTHKLLYEVVESIECFPNWHFRLKDDGEGNLTLIVTVDGTNNYDRSEHFPVGHCHPVPMAEYNEASWRRWIHEQCMRTFAHELGECLQFDGVRPYAPMHGPGEDPYTVHEIRPEKDALTTQDGSLRPGPV